MDVFRLRDNIIGDYSKYIASFIEISDDRIREVVQQELEAGLLWPDPLLQLMVFSWTLRGRMRDCNSLSAESK